MEKKQYYDGSKLLSLKDINGQKPEIYMCTSNRAAGKTTFFNRLLVKRFLQQRKKFGLIYRYNTDMVSPHERFFKEIQALFFPDWGMASAWDGKQFIRMYLFPKGKEKEKSEWMECGYCFSINQAEKIKNFAHLFSDVSALLFEEFQLESGNYIPGELLKFQSLHSSVARGGGKQSRYVPVYMLSNLLTMLNPYYAAFGVSERLRDDTQFLRGDGWVLEQTWNEAAASAAADSAFNRAFGAGLYTKSLTEKIYLHDSKTFIERPKGRSNYLATLKVEGTEYGIREYPATGLIYCDDSPDSTYPLKLAVTTEDHNINFVMLRQNPMFISNLRYYFERGAFRFKNLSCKAAVLKTLSYW